jgi:hypothetical protein
VLSIMAILMGLAAGYLRSAGRKLDVAASASTVESVIRLCRDHSRVRGLPSRVVFDRDTGTLWGAAQQVVGEWHFERQVGGQIIGYGNPCTPKGGRILDQWVGRRWGSCYEFTEGQHVQLDCGTSTAFDGRSGVLAEAWIYLEKAPPVGGMTIFRKGKVFALRLLADGQLQAEVDLERTGQVRVQTKDLRLGLHVWFRVALDYDGEALRIHVNHTERAARAASGLLEVEEQSSFLISDSQQPFEGIMDEVRLSMLVGNTRRQLAEGVTFEADYPPLRFGWDGTLDLRAMELALAELQKAGHLQDRTLSLPVQVVVTRRGAAERPEDRRIVEVDYYGTITTRIGDTETATVPPPSTGGTPR